MSNKDLNTASCQTDVRRRCIDCIEKVIGKYNEHFTPNELDDLDFIEIVMETELEFNSRIDDSSKNYKEIETMDEFIDWLISYNVA